jgi:hypothetical protein
MVKSLKRKQRKQRKIRTKQHRKRGTAIKKSRRIRLKIKNLGNIKRKIKTRKYKRIQYGCKNTMKGGSALLNIGSNVSNQAQNVVLGGYNTLSGLEGNELYGGPTSYP